MSKSATPSTLRLKQSPAKWSPHTYQRKALKWLLEHGAAALFLDPGLGKTSVTLAAFAFLLKRKVASKLLVIAPLRVCYQVWPAEAKKWSDFAHLRVAVLHGPKKEEALASDADVYVINPEGLEWLIYGSGDTKNFNPKRWRKLGFDTLCIDELTKFKHPSGVRFKALKLVLGSFARRWGLTGTPAANGLLDLFGQCYVLDQGNALGRYITHYKVNYFTNPDNNGWKWVLRPGAKEQIYEKIKPLALRMSADDYLSLPPMVDDFTMLDLPSKLRKTYDALEDDLFAKFGTKEIVAANSATASGKLRQVANGGLYVDNDVKAILGGKERATLHLHDVKTDWLEELVESLNGSPLLVAYEFHHDLERLQKRFKALPYIGGGITGAASAAHEAAWNAGDYPLMAVQPASVAHGLNLQMGDAAHLAHYAMTWNLEHYDQLIRRIWRQGTKAKTIFRYHAVMRDTVDMDMRYALVHKTKTQKGLFDALAARRLVKACGYA